VAPNTVTALTTAVGRQPHVRTIGVLGSYGGLNIGDEAILEAILDSLIGLRPDARIVVFSRNPEETKRRHPRVAEVIAWEGTARAEVSAAMSKVDLLVLGGGGILYDGEAQRYLRVVEAARNRGIPVFVYAVGAGPLTDPDARAAVTRGLSDVSDLVVRDQESRRVLEEIGVDREITVAADPALLLTPAEFPAEWLTREAIPVGERLVGMSVREPGRAAEHLDEAGYHALLATAADFLIHRLDAHVVFVPMERDDVRHSHAVLSHMTNPERGRILNSRYSPRELLGFMQHLEFAVGMRLHFLIFAAVSGVPFLPLPYAGKVFDFAQAVGAPALRGVAREQAGPLLAEIDRLWDEYPQRLPRLRDRVRELQRRAQTTARRLEDVLDSLEAGKTAPGQAPDAPEREPDAGPYPAPAPHAGAAPAPLRTAGRED
jgi:polysaccharide pyruvyl transferase CsaB